MTAQSIEVLSLPGNFFFYGNNSRPDVDAAFELSYLSCYSCQQVTMSLWKGYAKLLNCPGGQVLDTKVTTSNRLTNTKPTEPGRLPAETVYEEILKVMVTRDLFASCLINLPNISRQLEPDPLLDSFSAELCPGGWIRTAIISNHHYAQSCVDKWNAQVGNAAKQEGTQVLLNPEIVLLLL